MKTLFVSDLHLGKKTISGERATSADLDRLSISLKVTGAQKLIILGDFIHGSKGHHKPTREAFSEWRTKHASLPIELVRGNHDRKAGDPPDAWNIETVNRHPLNDFILTHEPFEPKNSYANSYALAGHLHPAAEWRGKGQQFPCFWFGARCGILPAFGSPTTHGLIQPRRGDRVFVIAGSDVIGL